jgi:hypothetical protein
MLTDDDLIRELEAGFRDESQGLTYSGRVPAPRRDVVPWTAVPIAAAAAAVIVLPQLGGGGTPTATPAPPRATQTVPQHVQGSFGPGPSAPAGNGHVRLVTTSFEFAGRTFRIQRPANQPLRYIVCRIGAAAPPADATPVPKPFDIEKAWSGRDPKTGDAAVWIKDSRFFHGQYLEMSSPSFTEQELVTMLQTPPDQQ